MPSVNIRLSDPLHAALKAQAAAEDRSLAWIINKTLEDRVVATMASQPPWVPKPNSVRGPLNHVPVVVDPDCPPGDIYLTDKCLHPKSRIVKGQCQACSEYVG